MIPILNSSSATLWRFWCSVLHIVPDLEQAQISDINEKYDSIASVIADKRLVSVSGTPDWLLVVLRRTAERAGAKSFGELWPHMEFFAHGGMSMIPYKPIYEREFAPRKITFIENYNASEGFFGVQTDTNDSSMLLMLDYDVFFEFIPMSEYGKLGARPVPLWEAETGVDYALLVSTSSGLWRYDIGDVIRFTRKAPYKFVIVGRTHQCISVWGEDLSVQQAEDHDYEHFSADAGGIIQPLEVIEARRGLFYEWLDSKGKLGGQHKVPRLSSNRTQFEELLALN
ncbi:MAG: GH3 auxin-responsive promoter family protein [Bacteroidales bacterium]|nr:GH3 auxin-responsive promoter family protein [Bacteroidales bacterium]